MFPPAKKSSCIELVREAERGSLQALEILWSWAKEGEIDTGILLLAQIGV